MPYGDVTAYRIGNRITIEIELPDQGEQADSGRSENLVDPREWTDVDDEGEHLGVRVVVCRPNYRPFRRGQRRRFDRAEERAFS